LWNCKALRRAYLDALSNAFPFYVIRTIENGVYDIYGITNDNASVISA